MGTVQEYFQGNKTILNFSEARQYIKSPSDAPKGIPVKRGPKGGFYIDSADTAYSQSKELPEQTHQEVKHILSKIPKKMSALASGELKQTNRKVVAMIDVEDGHLYIGPKWAKATPEQKEEVVYHELAHIILKRWIDKVDPEVIQLYHKGFKEEPKFADDVVEDFADSIAAYWIPRYRYALANNAPQKFKAVRQLVQQTGLEESNAGKAKKLYTKMFDGIGDGAGYPRKTEYHVGVSNISEEAHCIFGSAMKAMAYQTPERNHIAEELELIEDNIVEYNRNIPHYAVDNDAETISNARRVLAHTSDIEKQLNLLTPDNKEERDYIIVANISNLIIHQVAEAIINHPEQKPFDAALDSARTLRKWFDKKFGK